MYILFLKTHIIKKALKYIFRKKKHKDCRVEKNNYSCNEITSKSFTEVGIKFKLVQFVWFKICELTAELSVVNFKDLPNFGEYC